MRRGSPEYTHNVADDNRRGVLLQVARRDDVVHPQRELGELEREKHPQDNLEPMQRSGRRGHSERGRHSGRGTGGGRGQRAKPQQQNARSNAKTACEQEGTRRQRASVMSVRGGRALLVVA